MGIPNFYALTGPTSGIKGVAQTFTLTPQSTVTDTVTFSSSPAGTFTPTSLSWSASSAAKTFTFTPNTPADYLLTFTSGLGDTITQSPFAYTATAAYGWVRVQSAFVDNFPATSVAVTLNGITAGNVLFLAVATQPGVSPTITDTQGGSWTLNGNNLGAIIYQRVITASGNLAVTVSNGSATSLYVGIAEYRLPPGSTFGVVAGIGQDGSGSSVSIPSLAITPQSNVAVVIAVQALSACTAGTGFAGVQDVRGVSGGVGLFFEEALNSFGSTITPTATCPGAGSWHAVALSYDATMPDFSLIGPTNIPVGSPASFNLVPTGTAASDTVTLSSSIAGTFSPASLTVTASPDAVPFTFTPSVTGIAKITLTSSGGHSIGASPFSLGSFVNLTVAGPTKGVVGTAYTFAITPAGTTTDTISYNDGGAGGTFSPPGSITFPNTSSAQTITYTPGSAGSHTLTFTSADGGTITGSPASFLASNVVVSPLIVKSGTVALFMTPTGSGGSNGNWPLAFLYEVNSNPTFKVNGFAASFGPPVWMDRTQDGSQVGYRALCGGVRSICMSAAGENYTSPTVTWNGDGGGSGHTVGTPALATGVTSYTITNAGSGLTDGGQYWAPGGTFGGYPAMAWLTVSGGSVTSVIPLSGSPFNVGGGYSGSFSATFGNATIECNVSNYISGIPVLTPGTGFTSPPTYTITDATGTGAVAVPSMALAATDVVTYTAADNWLNTDVGGVLGATDATIPNFVGQLEGPSGHVSGFLDQPTTKFGGERAGGGQQTSFENTFKNKMSSATPFGGAGVILDSNYLPVSWTPGGTITCAFGGSAYGLQNFPFGVYTVVYDDPGTDTTTVTLTPNFTFIDQVKSGTTITQRWQWQQGIYATGSLNITSSSGKMAISMPWVFAPGNTIDRSNPYAADDAIVANFTNPDGSGPAHFRSMEDIGGTGFNNLVDASDFPSTSLFNGINLPAPATAISPVAYRFLNTNPAKSSTGDNTYPWPASTKLYSSQPWANSGSDSFGTYLDMTAGPLGVNDNGNILSLGGATPGDHGVVEFRTSGPHGLKTGQFFDTLSHAAAPGYVIQFVSGTATIPSNGIETVPMFVTGPDTFALLLGSVGGTSTSGVDTVKSTAEIPMAAGDMFVLRAVPYSSAWFPYEHQAEFASRWPNTNLWLNVAPASSHGLIVEVCNRVCNHLGSTNGVIFEIGDEHWNFGLPYILNYQYLVQMTNFIKYAPSGQPFLTYATGGASLGLASGQATPMNTLLSADLFNTFKTQWVANGRDPSKLIQAYGGRWQSADTAAATAETILQFGIPQTNCVSTVAPYTDIEPGQSTINQAYADAGNAAFGSPGNWPVDAINDFERHINFYNRTFWNYWSETYAALAGTSLRLSTYEGSIQSMMDRSQGGARVMPGAGNITGFDAVQDDCMQHPSWADRVYAYFLAQQRGNPTVANSGAVYGSYLNVWGGIQIGGNNVWFLNLSPAMPAGLGVNNSFMTPQGGFNGSHNASSTYGNSQANQAPGFKGLLNFNAAAASSTVVGFALSGPTSGAIGVALTYTLTPDATTTDTVTIAVTGGGTLSTTTLTFTASNSPQTFTYTAASNGSKTITLTSTAGGIITGSPHSVVIASTISYTLAGASSGFDGVPITLTVTPSGVVTDTVTLSDGSGGGVFLPSATLTFSGSSTPISPTYTPGSTGTKSITATSTAGDTVTGSPLSISVAARGFTVAGAGTGFVGNSIAYTVTPSGATTDTMTFSDASGGAAIANGSGAGTFSPTSLSWSGTSTAQVVQYTPGSAGIKSLTFTSADGGIVIHSPMSLVASQVSYTVTGPTSGSRGNALTYTVTPAASATDTITVSHSGVAGTLSKATLAFTSSATAQTFTFTPSANGAATITLASSNGGTITGAPITLAVSQANEKGKRYLPTRT